MSDLIKARRRFKLLQREQQRLVTEGAAADPEVDAEIASLIQSFPALAPAPPPPAPAAVSGSDAAAMTTTSNSLSPAPPAGGPPPPAVPTNIIAPSTLGPLASDATATEAIAAAGVAAQSSRPVFAGATTPMAASQGTATAASSAAPAAAPPPSGDVAGVSPDGDFPWWLVPALQLYSAFSRAYSAPVFASPSERNGLVFAVGCGTAVCHHILGGILQPPPQRPLCGYVASTILNPLMLCVLWALVATLRRNFGHAGGAGGAGKTSRAALGLLLLLITVAEFIFRVLHAGALVFVAYSVMGILLPPLTGYFPPARFCS